MEVEYGSTVPTDYGLMQTLFIDMILTYLRLLCVSQAINLHTNMIMKTEGSI